MVVIGYHVQRLTETVLTKKEHNREMKRRLRSINWHSTCLHSYFSGRVMLTEMAQFIGPSLICGGETKKNEVLNKPNLDAMPEIKSQGNLRGLLDNDIGTG